MGKRPSTASVVLSKRARVRQDLEAVDVAEGRLANMVLLVEIVEYLQDRPAELHRCHKHTLAGFFKSQEANSDRFSEENPYVHKVPQYHLAPLFTNMCNLNEVQLTNAKKGETQFWLKLMMRGAMVEVGMPNHWMNKAAFDKAMSDRHEHLQLPLQSLVLRGSQINWKLSGWYKLMPAIDGAITDDHEFKEVAVGPFKASIDSE